MPYLSLNSPSASMWTGHNAACKRIRSQKTKILTRRKNTDKKNNLHLRPPIPSIRHIIHQRAILAPIIQTGRVLPGQCARLHLNSRTVYPILKCCCLQNSAEVLVPTHPLGLFFKDVEFGETWVRFGVGDGFEDGGGAVVVCERLVSIH